MAYLDTSVVVAALTREAATHRVQEWIGAQASMTLTISDWVETEFAAAISLKVRTKQLPDSLAWEARRLFDRLSNRSFARLPVSTAEFLAAARYTENVELGLRAGDALHLAIAAQHRQSLATLDHRLASAAGVLGVQTALPDNFS